MGYVDFLSANETIMSSGLITIRAQWRAETIKAIAVWDGVRLSDAGKEIWTWLPKAEITYERSGHDVEITLRQWLLDRHQELEILTEDALADVYASVLRVERLEERIARIEQHLGLKSEND